MDEQSKRRGMFSSDDVDATAKQAEQLGGKVCVAPQDIPGVGRFCVIQDPQGGVINPSPTLRIPSENLAPPASNLLVSTQENEGTRH
jgi:hypothetical protein